MLFSLLACEQSKDDDSNFLEKNADYACGDLCGIQRPSVDGFHVEIEAEGEKSQVFYSVDRQRLSSQAIMLKEQLSLEGDALGFKAWFKKDASTKDDGPRNIVDIVAILLDDDAKKFAWKMPYQRSTLGLDGHFFIDLLSETSYLLVLNPAGDFERAPLYLNTGLISKDSTLSFKLTPNPITLRGQVEAKDLTAKVPMSARIIQGSRLISSIAKIKEDGHFSLELSDPLPMKQIDLPIMLIVEPSDSDVAWPRFRQKLSLLSLKDDSDLGIIDMGRLQAPISATIKVLGPDERAVKRAFIFMSARIGSGQALLKRQVDSLGTLTIEPLHEGVYDIAVVPPFESPWAMQLIKGLKFDDHAEPIYFRLEKRAALLASITDFAGQALEGAQIEFFRIGEMNSFATEDIYEDMLFKLTAITDETGRVCGRSFGFDTSKDSECSHLLLDEGKYWAHVIPPAGRELPHKWLSFDFPTQNDLKISLEQPQLLSGRVLRKKSNQPVPHAYVTIYLGGAAQPKDNLPKVISHARSDEQGRFTAFVPPFLGD